VKRFDSADFEMEKTKGGEGGKSNLLSRTLAAEAQRKTEATQSSSPQPTAGQASSSSGGDLKLTRQLSNDLDRVADETVDVSIAAVMAEQEAIAKKKFGNLAKNPAARVGKREKTKRFDSADFEMQKSNDGSPRQSLLQRTLAAEGVKTAVPAGNSIPEQDVVAEQEKIAVSKYGALAPKNAAAAMRRREAVKRFDSADFEMEKTKGGEGGKSNLLSRTLAAEAQRANQNQ